VSFDAFDSPREVFALWDDPQGFVVEADGLRHPSSPRRGRRIHTRTEDLTHVATTDRYLWIGTRRGVHMVPRWRFVDGQAPERAVLALRSRVGECSDGAERLARMARVDALADAPGGLWATRTLAVLCVAVYALQLLGGPNVFISAYFSPILFADGDLWRAATANLLHGFFLHLVFNVFGLVVAGRIVERALGASRTIVLMGAAAVASMVASGLAGQGAVVGASGIVFGLVGGVLWLEIGCAARLPAWWRFPRSVLMVVLVALALDVGLGFALDFVAGEAHVGGFAAGLLVAAALTRGVELGPGESRAVRRAAAAVAGVAGISVLAAAVPLLGEGDFTARHAMRLVSIPGVSPEELNNHAWLIAVDPEANTEQMNAALQLAERAVAETGRREPTMLDTLAEVQFQLGWAVRAVDTIDEAIARAPRQSYYREQRRRFTGERDADDRPPDPALVPSLRRRESPQLPPDDHGLRV